MPRLVHTCGISINVTARIRISMRRVNRELHRLVLTWENANMSISLIKQQYVTSAEIEAIFQQKQFTILFYSSDCSPTNEKGRSVKMYVFKTAKMILKFKTYKLLFSEQNSKVINLTNRYCGPLFLCSCHICKPAFAQLALYFGGTNSDKLTFYRVLSD